MSLNIRSLTKHLCQLKNTITKYQTDFIALSEIWNPNNDFVKLNNYHQIITKKRPPGKSGGGVGLYIHQKFKYEPHNEINNLKLKTLEIISTKIQINESKHITIIAAYKPPKSNPKETLNDLEILLQTINNKPTIIAGDLNINVATDNTIANNYTNKLLEHNMIQTVMTNTRITANSQTTIDHVITNQPTVQTIVTHEAISDHQVLITSLGQKTHKTPTNCPTTLQQKLDITETARKIKRRFCMN